MRNWNSWKCSKKSNHQGRLSRAYEELKPLRLFVFFIISIVYRVPMRNWNNDFSISEPSKITFIACLWGIETASDKAIVACLLGLSRAYEELKLWSSFICIIVSSSVYRVPMRNWNVFWLVSFSTPLVLFIACLWGIETCKSTTEAMPAVVFIACLWGIETYGGPFRSFQT